jgi:predicted alpha/beta hydrolase
MSGIGDGDASVCPFRDWPLYCPHDWEMLDDNGKLQVQYAAKLFLESFLVPGVLIVRNSLFI